MTLPEVTTLARIAAGVGFVGLSGMFFMEKHKRDKVATSPFFREAMKILRSHPGAIKYMGEPIKQLGFDANDDNNWSDGTKAKFNVRVKGPKDKGSIYFWAKKNEENKWDIRRLELELKSTPDRRLLIKDGAVDETEFTFSG